MKKLALVVLALALTGAALWWWSERDGRRGRPRATESGPEAPASSPASEPELRAAAEHEVEGARSAPGSEAAAFGLEHATFALEDAEWLEVEVLLPAEIAPDDRPALLGFARRHGDEHDDHELRAISAALGLDDSFAAELEHEHWSRRALAPRVRLPFPRGTRDGVLFLQSRDLHLDPVRVPAGARVLTIEPELGGRLTGRCTFPAGRTASSAEISISFEGREPGTGLAGFAAVDERRARVRADLSFELRALSPSRTYALACEAEGFVGQYELSFAVAPGERRELVVAFRAGATVSGVVTAGGAPLAGAEVALEPRSGKTWQSGRTLESATDGRFAFAGVPDGKFVLTAEKDGWREARSATFEVRDGRAPEPFELVLDAGLNLRGVVRWPDGRPAAKARVELARQRADWREDETELVCDDAGRFTASGLEAETLDVLAMHYHPNDEPSADVQPGLWMARAVATPGGPELVLTLAPPIAIRGRVVDEDGAPVTNFQVHASPVDGSEDDPAGVAVGFETRDGTFTLEVGNLPGEWRVYAAQSERVSEGATLVVPQAAELLLVLPRASRVTGRVLDPTGRPVPSAEVHLSATLEEAGYLWGGGSDTSSDAEGRFELESGAPGGFLHATHEAWAASEPVALELAPGEELAEVVLALRRGGRVTGEVFDAEGRPHAGQNVRCSSGPSAALMLAFAGERATVSDSAGRFVLEHVTPGRVTVAAVPGEDEFALLDGAEDEQALAALFGAMRTATLELADGDEAHVVLGTAPKRPVRVHGRVLEAGALVPETKVMALAEGGALLSGMKVATTDARGAYELVLDRPGDFVFGVGNSFEQGLGTQFYVSVPAVDAHALDLELPTGRIAGRVFGPDGPASGVGLRLVASLGRLELDELSESLQATSASDGRFTFTRVEPGSYVLQLGADPFGLSARYGQRVLDGLVLERGGALEGLEVRLEKPGTLRGLVRDAEGAPAGGLTVFVRDAEGHGLSLSSCTTDAAGRFVYEGIAPGRVTASARGNGLATPESAAVELASGASAEVELTAAPGTFLRIALLLDDEPVRARLAVRDAAGRRVDDLLGLGDLMTLVGEGFSIRERRVGPLVPGRYTLVATTLDGKDARSAVVIEPGQRERVVKLRLK